MADKQCPSSSVDSGYFAQEMRSALRLAGDYPRSADAVMDERLCTIAHIAMTHKLERKRREGRGGWWDSGRCSVEQLRELLRQHVEKGDMVDVMNLAAMVFARECAGLEVCA